MLFLPLIDLPIGESCVVRGLAGEGPARRRMLELGITEGTLITAAFSSPFGDPVAYRVRNTFLAIRSEDARGILVEPLAP